MTDDLARRILAVPRTWEDIEGCFDYYDYYRSVADRLGPPSFLGGGAPRIVEIGCFLGRSTCALLSILRDRGLPADVWAVDHCVGSTTDPTGQDVAAMMDGSYAGLLHRNVLACGPAPSTASEINVSVVISDSVDAAGLFGDDSLDFVFLDADHSKSSVLRDLGAWAPKCRGLLAGHDYQRHEECLKGVTLAVDHFFGGRAKMSPIHNHVWEVNMTLFGRGPR